MKIAASNIMYNSTALFERISHETIYSFDENQMVLEKEETRKKESSHTTAAAYYHTNADDGAKFKHAPNTRISQDVKTEKQPEIGQEEGFEKNIYLASVFIWAADTIDKLVSGFEQEKASRESKAGETISSRGLQTSFAGDAVGSTLGEQRIKIYRGIASSLRAKALGLMPEEQVSADTRFRRTLIMEQENLNVQAQGMIQTMDGREIIFSLDVKMHRENIARSTQTMLIDPLVINFEGDSAELTGEKIYFDLDSDGTPEQISTLEKGSGFLALDFNKDGLINNGSELFGPSTGNGFRELALFDSDSNNWIDENDPVYKDLLIWSQEDSKGHVLKKLAKAGIGAIHLGSVDSAFIIKGAGDHTLGQVVQTGVVLGENGEVKTIQQINLTV